MQGEYSRLNWVLSLSSFQALTLEPMDITLLVQRSLQIQSSEVKAFKTKLNPMRLVSLKKEIICKVLISKIYSKLTYPIKAKQKT